MPIRLIDHNLGLQDGWLFDVSRKSLRKFPDIKCNDSYKNSKKQWIYLRLW